MTHVVGGMRQKYQWETWELDHLRANYATGNLNEMARELGRSRKALQFKAGKLGLRRCVQETRRRKFEIAAEQREKTLKDGHVQDWDRKVLIVSAPSRDPYVRTVVNELPALERAWLNT